MTFTIYGSLVLTMHGFGLPASRIPPALLWGRLKRMGAAINGATFI